LHRVKIHQRRLNSLKRRSKKELILTSFGEILRAYRQAGNDPDRLHRRLTQERLGDLIGDEMGDLGVSGPAISYWESGESRINAQDRGVLLALIKVLHRCGGLKTLLDANRLLRAGHYSELNTEELEEVFGKLSSAPNIEQTKRISSKSLLASLVANLFAISENDLRGALAKAEEGPSPSWPRKLAAFMRKGTDGWSLSISSVFWVVAWILAWWLLPPSLHWPFADRNSAFSAMIMYMGGTVAVPLLIGSLIKTRDSDYWKQQGLAHSKLLRIYTYQGAAIGFNLGYFFILPFVLMQYYLQLGTSVWLELAAVTLGLILANMGARVVPHNLWLVYRRMAFKDGAIFFAVAFVGPLWGFFFLEFYSVLLEPRWGSLVILVALLLFIMIPIGQSKRKANPEQAQP
jgi:hypothetical protein